MEIKDVFFSYCWKKPGNGANTLFWEDNWIWGKSLGKKIPYLYRITHTHYITLAEVKQNGWGSTIFRRNLLGDNLRDWNYIKNCCDQVNLNDSKDETVWGLTKNGIFSVKSFYTGMKMQEAASMMGVIHKKIWQIKVPLKIRIFLWLLLKDSVLTKDNLKKRGWKKGNETCQFCDKKESIQHLFFDCPMTRLGMWWHVLLVCNL